MKRAILRTLACFMAISMFVLVVGGFTFADTDKIGELLVSGYETDIVVEDIDCEYTEQAIIDILNGEVLITPNSIFCLFGHNISTGTALVTEHRVWSSSPRCRRTTYRVEHCTRSSCNYMTMTQTTQVRITCCS